MSIPARIFILATVIIGGLIVVGGALHWHSDDPLRLICYAALASIAGACKVTLPNVDGSVSVTFLFTLLGIVELSNSELLLVSIVSSAFQALLNTKVRPQLVKVLFSLANTAIAVTLCRQLYHWPVLSEVGMQETFRLALVALAYFLLNTIPVSAIIAVTENKRAWWVWRQCYFWSFAYYLVGAVLAAAMVMLNRLVGWQASILTLPVIYLVYRSYSLYLGRLAAEKSHAQEIAALHLRTIEALALAIEAKDQTTHEHLQRVQVYALEVGKRCNLNPVELEALRAAALLHDIGKLAVPEHIISKPGRLTPEEFEKMKIHPVVGADILERVQFPYPVAPIVRAHHERWDGTGYPYGLKEEQIPIGARILSAIDCLDALASDRQYRRAYPLEVAMRMVADEAGKAFDPQVVKLLSEEYVELERLARLAPPLAPPESPEKGLATQAFAVPLAGFDMSDKGPPADVTDFLRSIAAARVEMQTLLELVQDVGKSLSINETLSVLATRLKRLVPYDSIAIYLRKGDVLRPEFVAGDDFRLFASLEIPVGHGLSGWVVENRKAIINGNPSVEPGYLNDTNKFSILRSALSVPLEGLQGVVGALTLYRSDLNAFHRDHLRILQAVASKITYAIENAVRFQLAESNALTDFKTGLPNARALYFHLDSEVSRCRRTGTPLSVLVCDLNEFKHINDHYGHLEGDRVLQGVASTLRTACREYDYVARMGGDEFVLVFPGLQSRDIEQKVASIRGAVHEFGVSKFGSSVFSISIGVASYRDGIDTEALLAHADRQMYECKQEFKAGKAAASIAALAGQTPESISVSTSPADQPGSHEPAPEIAP